MSPDRYTQRSCYALGAALALAASTALAETSAQQQPVPEASAATTLTALHSTTPFIYPSSETGLRRAVEQGPVALHLYIYRTRMIYNYYFWDFVEKE